MFAPRLHDLFAFVIVACGVTQRIHYQPLVFKEEKNQCENKGYEDVAALLHAGTFQFSPQS